MTDYRRARPAVAAFAAFVCILSAFVFGGNYPDSLDQRDDHDISFYRAPDSEAPPANPAGLRPRHIILCIGDGMGIDQVALARRFGTGGASGRLWMERMPVAGLMRTHNAEGRITDSAASVTAILCGVKTRNGRIGRDPDGVSWMSLPRCLQQEGWRIGAVATSTITHATPAGLIAAIRNRGEEAEIAAQMLEAGAHVLFGGGRKQWLPKSEPEGERNDGRNLLAEAHEAGYQIVTNQTQMSVLTSGPVIGLFHADALTTMAPEPSLAEMTASAIRILSADAPEPAAPFFLLMEGSQIDWACHHHNAEVCIRQTLLFDMAVKEALDFAAADGQTLVVVTADHETGGMTLTEDDKGRPRIHWSTGGHSAADVPIYAFGPGAERFGGVLDSTELSGRLAALLEVDAFPRRLSETKKSKNEPALQTSGR